MVTVYTDKQSSTIYLVPSSDAENADISKNPIPGDFWVNIEGSKRPPVYARQQSPTDSAADNDGEPTSLDLPLHITATCTHFLQQQNPKKQIKQLSWCQLSPTTSFAKCEKHSTKPAKITTENIGEIEASKKVRTNVDFEAEQSAFLAQKVEQNTKKYRENKKVESENSRTYKESAEINRKGYTDLFDDESMQMASNQNRDENWEDDFM